MDTIYGNPKSVKETIKFLDRRELLIQKKNEERSEGYIFNLNNYKTKSLRLFLQDYGKQSLTINRIFNKKGLLESLEYNSLDEFRNRQHLYKYDEKNRLKKEIQYHDEGDIITYLNFYDHNDSLKSSSRYYSLDEKMFLHNYYYRDDKGYLVGYTKIDEDDVSFFRFELNKEGKKIREFRSLLLSNIILNKPEFYLTKSYKYDLKGNLVLEKFFKEDGKLRFVKTYKYDEENNLIQTKSSSNLSHLKLANSLNYKYDSKGNLIEFSELMNYKYGIIVKKFKYNSGDFIEEINQLEGNHIRFIKFKYKFDSYGNWKEILKIVNGKPLYKWQRKIKYY